MDRLDLLPLVRAGLLDPVEPGSDDERLWLDCELASLAEHRLGDLTDPRALDAATRLRWAREVTREALPTLAGRISYEFAFWLLEDGARVGTLAVSHSLLGMRDARVSSLYVLPDRRGGGVGRRALARLRALLGEQRCGYRLETSWCWPRVVRFYLRAGLWVRMWKHDLQFCDGASLPRAEITVGADEITVGAEGVVLARATLRDGAMSWEERAVSKDVERRFGEAAYHAHSTLAVVMALEAWPLVRSEALRESRGWGDAGAPEALAARIPVWEAMDRAQGWRVAARPIPGIAYPSYAELQARWDEEDRAWKARTAKGIIEDP